MARLSVQESARLAETRARFTQARIRSGEKAFFIEHGRVLNAAVYRKLLSAHLSRLRGYGLWICVSESVEGYPRVQGDKPVDELDYLTFAREHLESGYKEIYDAWNAVNLLIKQYNEATIPAILSLEQVIKSQMEESYPTLTEYDETKQTNYYNVQNLLAVFHDVLVEKIIVAGKPLEFIPTIQKDSYKYMVQMGALPYLIVCDKESDANADRLKRVFAAVKIHPNVAPLFENLRSLYPKTDITLKQFVARLKIPIESLDLGDPIRGKCDIDY